MNLDNITDACRGAETQACRLGSNSHSNKTKYLILRSGKVGNGSVLMERSILILGSQLAYPAIYGIQVKLRKNRTKATFYYRKLNE